MLQRDGSLRQVAITVPDFRMPTLALAIFLT